MYYRYEVTFSAYVLTPGEKLVMNSVVLLSLGLVGYTLLSCLPNFIFQTFQRIVLSYAVPNDQISVTMGNVSREVGNTSSAWNRMTDVGYEVLVPILL